MKLASRYQRINLLVTLSIFLCASIAFYILLHRVLIGQVDQDLQIEQHEIQAYVARYGALPQNVIQVEDQMVRYEKTTAAASVAATYQNSSIYDPTDKTTDEFRQVVFTISVSGQWYQISISKSLESTEGLANDIGLIALSVVLLTLLITVLLNRMVLRKLWKPFYTTLDKVKGYAIGSGNILALQPTRIDEFAILNETLQAAINKAEKDYQALKEFTENAAHELQTPLAIIRSKMDLLIQEESLTEHQSGLMQEIYNAIRRMTYLNRSLLMLAKISNGQFGEATAIDLKVLLEDKLQELDALVQQRKLHIVTVLAPAVLHMNPMLADILLNNLLSNPIEHNYEGGSITIELTEQRLVIGNTSQAPALNEANLFHRFYKATEGATRTGLGLAIAREVSVATGYSIAYHYANDMHYFSVNWNSR